MESTLILEACCAASLSGMVLVTTTSVIGEFTRISTAAPESTGCEQQAYTALAPFSISACATFTSVPAVSIRSSMIRQVRPWTSPITCITSATFISTRRLSTMASAASIFLAKKRARSTPPASGETTVRSGRFSFLK